MMKLTEMPLPVKIVVCILLLAAAVGIIYIFGFLIELFQTSFVMALDAWGNFGASQTPEVRLLFYALALLLMLLSGYFFPVVMDRLNELPRRRLAMTVKIIYCASSFIVLLGSAMLGMNCVREDVFWLAAVQVIAGIAVFSWAVRLWGR